MRKTKIICTIGPSCMDEKVLKQMCKAGMNVARMNFSHGDHAEQKEKMDMIKKVREELGMPIAILLDTKGPEFRTKSFRDGKVTLKEGQEFAFTTLDIEGDSTRVGVNYDGIVNDLDVGDTVLVANGLFVFTVTSITATDVITTVVAGGELGSKKSMSFPNKVMNKEYLSEQDKSDILFGIQNDVDYVACSFVSRAQDIIDVREFVEAHGGDVEYIAKIENRAGIDNFEEIANACDGIMIARGDLGVEVPFTELPVIQKTLIKKCRFIGKKVITATEMLESMITNVRPTRAEISDVANAVYDGTSAIMLSGETAQGKYPVKTVKTMNDIVEETEKHMPYFERYMEKAKGEFRIKNAQDATAHATCSMALDIEAKGIVACTKSGMTAKMISRYRAGLNIVGMTTCDKIYRRLALSWGVTPVITDVFEKDSDMFRTALEVAKKVLPLKKGDRIVLAGGSSLSQGVTNIVKIEEI